VTRTESDVEAALDAFYADISSVDLQPLWTQTKELVPSAPRPAAVPWLWQGTTLRALAHRARDLITIERGGERRVLGLSNPGLGGAPFATPTLWGAIQALGPYESAPAHRHSASAIRFVLEGDGVWTTVDGDGCRMAPGDVVLTPAWTFHDHTNGGDTPMLWFDGLDLPLVNTLDASFFEHHLELRQPVVGFDLSAQRYGTGLVPHGRLPLSASHSPLYVYRWAETDALLTRMASGADEPMTSIEFVSPTTGGPVLPTLTCVMHRLKPGARTPSHRKVASSIFVVYRGAGRSVIDGTAFDWARGDMFVVPSWAAVDHEAENVSDLFELTDEAVLRALHLFRDEDLGEQQSINGSFSPKGVNGE
jgi:gentisate 1,2-dioxygenase